MERKKQQKNQARNDKTFRNLSTPKRSFVKGIVWEAISFVVTSIAVFTIYGNLEFSLRFSLCLSLIKIILFFAHERAWKKVRWGKV